MNGVGAIEGELLGYGDEMVGIVSFVGASGDDGVADLIPPGAELEFDIEILDAQPPMQNIDFDSIAMADNTPVRAKPCHASNF